MLKFFVINVSHITWFSKMSISQILHGEWMSFSIKMSQLLHEIFWYKYMLSIEWDILKLKKEKFTLLLSHKKEWNTIWHSHLAECPVFYLTTLFGRHHGNVSEHLWFWYLSTCRALDISFNLPEPKFYHL